MDADRWARVEEIYYRVLDSPVEQRGRLLEECCGADGELRAEVESLLSAQEEAGDFLNPEPLRAEWREAGRASEVVGTAIGPYQVEGRLGAGAMGEV